MRKPKSDFTISAKYKVTLADLGRKGCANYVFNEAARGRVAELLDLMGTICSVNKNLIIDQSRVEEYLKDKLSSIGKYKLTAERTPLEIAANHSRLHVLLVAEISRQLNEGMP
jgi:hypothetical protein